MKISQSGHSWVPMPRLLSSHLRGPLFRMRNGRVAHPRTVLPCFHARTQAVAIARAVALQHVVEFAPINRTEIVVPFRFIPFEVWVGHRDAEKIGLRNGLVDESLP